MNTKYGHKAGWVERAIIVFFILWGMATICKVAGAEPTLCITPPSKGILMVGVKHPPTGKRFSLMVSHDLKTWSIDDFVIGFVHAHTGNSVLDQVQMSPVFLLRIGKFGDF